MAKKTSYKVVNARQMTWPLEDGSTETRAVTLWLDPRGTPHFIYKVPEYIQKNLGVASEVCEETAEKAKTAFDALVRKYIEWVRTAHSEPVIILKVQYLGEDASERAIDEDSFFFSSSADSWDTERCVGVRYQLAFRVNGRLHYREMRYGDGDEKIYKVGSVMRDPDGKVLDYTPALHAKIDAICAAVNRAAQQLHEIIKAKDVAAKLMSTKLLENKP